MKHIKIAIRLLILWISVHIIYATIDGLRDNGKTSDVAVILGNKVNEDGTLSTRLEKRLECGLKLYENDRVSKIIVSGGTGKEGFAEAEKMKDYLMENGVPGSDIIVDNNGNNTRASAKNTYAICDSLNYTSVIVISQYYHLTRAKMLFRKYNFREVSSASPRYFEFRDIFSSLREFVAYYTQL